MPNEERGGLLILAIGRVLQVLVMFVGIKISTTFLRAEELGNLYIIATITNFFGLFLINPLGQYVNRHTHGWYAAGTLLNKLFVYNLYVLIVVVISFFIVSLLPAVGIGLGISYGWLILVVPAFIYFNTWNQTLAPVLNFLGRRVVFTILTVSSAALAVVFSFSGVKFFAATGIVWVLGQTGAYFLLSIVSLFCLVYFFRQDLNLSSVCREFKVENIVAVSRFAIPLSIGVFFLWMQGQSYRLVIERVLGVEFLGYFGLGIAIAVAIASAFESLIMQWVSPALYRNMATPELFKEFFPALVNFLLPIYFFLAVFVSFLSAPLIMLLVGGEYMKSCVFLVFGIWIEFFRVATGLLATAAHSTLQTYRLILPYALGGLGSILGVYLAAGSVRYEILIPATLVIMGGVTFIAMIYQMSAVLAVNLRAKSFMYLLFSAVVFALGYILFPLSSSLVTSFFSLSIFGVYFLMMIYFYARRQLASQALI